MQRHALALVLIAQLTCAHATARADRGFEPDTSALTRPIGYAFAGLAAAAVVALDVYVIGMALDFAVRQGNGLADHQWMTVELGLGLGHLGAGLALLGVGLENNQPELWVTSIPMLGLATFFWVHLIYSANDPGYDGERPRGEFGDEGEFGNEGEFGDRERDSGVAVPPQRETQVSPAIASWTPVVVPLVGGAAVQVAGRFW